VSSAGHRLELKALEPGASSGGARGRSQPLAGGLAAWLLAALAGSATLALAQGNPPRQVHAGVSPGFAHLGERVLYRGYAVYGAPSGARWLPPEPEPDLTWGSPRAWRARGPGGAETLFVEIPLQVFRLGAITLPGLKFQDPGPPHPEVQKLPPVTLVVQPVLTAADSNADLRPARGPLPAPWYERVPWLWVAVVLAAVLLAVLIVRWLRSRRRAAPLAPPIVLDPAALALAQLAELRALHLPERGRFDEHALRLSWILRRYLEAVTHAPRPGHTTPELVRALQKSPLGPDELKHLAVLLRVWDRLKFARAASSIEESMRSEQAVELLVRKLAEPAAGKAA